MTVATHGSDASNGAGAWRKTCFVTIGATASFSALIRACTNADFQRALVKHGYTELVVQYGTDGKGLFEDSLAQSAKEMSVVGFPVDAAGLDEHFRKVKEDPSNKVKQGLVLSHAGTGTILGAMRMGLPIVVVPNEELLDNHQVELAEALSQQGYVIHGRIDDLPRALAEAEQLRGRTSGWPPVNSGSAATSGSIQRVLDEEAGFLD